MTPGTESVVSYSHRGAVLLVLDVVGSTRLLEMDESGYISRWRQFLQDAIDGVLPAHGGRFHKSTGDGLMVRFGQAGHAVAAAFELQRLCRVGNAQRPRGEQIQLRIAAHVADCVEDAYDLYGHGVHLAARLLDVTGPGEVVVSEAVRRQLPGGHAVSEDLGERRLRHVSEPVRVHRLRPGGHPGDAPQVHAGTTRHEHPMAPGAAGTG